MADLTFSDSDEQPVPVAPVKTMGWCGSCGGRFETVHRRVVDHGPMRVGKGGIISEGPGTCPGAGHRPGSEP